MTDSRESFEEWAEARHWQEDAMNPEWCGALKGLYEIWSGGWSARDSEVERLREDAERYRWLRENAYSHADDGLPYPSRHEMNDWGKWINYVIEGEALDAAIDAARLSSQAKEPGNV